MTGFVEKTVAEQRFGASWNKYVEPALQAAESTMVRRRMFGYVVSGAALALIIVALGLAALAGPGSFFAAPLTIALVIALSALALIASWVPMLRGGADISAPVMAAVESHFGALLSMDENDAFASVLVQDLVTDGILSDGEDRILFHHSGHYRGCRIRLVEVARTVQPESPGSKAGRKSRRRRTANLVLARVSHPMVVGGEVRIDTAGGHAGDSTGQSFSQDPTTPPAFQARAGADLAPFKPAHRQLASIFSVLASDDGVAARLLTDEFAETLLRIQQQLANPLAVGADRTRIALQQVRGSVTLMIEDHATPATVSNRTTAEKLARLLVMRFATVPGLVDELHAESGPSSAFTPIDPVPARDQAPHLF